MCRTLKDGDPHSKLVILGIVSLFFVAMFSVGSPIRMAKAYNNTIYIRADGSINPSTAPISSLANVIYTLTGNVTESFVIEKDDIVVDGGGYTVQGVGGVGLDLSYRNHVTVRNFTVAGFSIGILLSNSDENSLKFNDATNNTDAGIRLYRSDHNKVMNNTALNNENGIYLISSDENSVMNNTALNNKYGIRVVDSGDCNFCWNNVTNNTYGIFLNSRQSATSDFIVLKNDISNNGVGIWLWGSSGNTVYHNNFFNNSIQGSLHDSHNNNWDNGLEGNYWSDYRGSDINKNAIGDAPYSIDENSQEDERPLMAKFQHFDIQIENEFYKIGTVCNCTILSEKNELSLRLSRVGSAAFCRLCIPNALIEPPYSVVVGPPYIEDNPLGYKMVETNGTHTWIYFVYSYLEDATITVVKAVKPLPFWFQWWFWGICVLVVTTATVFGKYLLQRKTIETYKRQLEGFRQVNHIDKTKKLFEADVRRCRRELEEFTRKHHIQIRHREESFEDALKRIGIKDKNKK